MTEETKPRGPYAQALRQLDELKELCRACAQELEDAASIRAGLMDSDSRRAEVQRQIQATLAHVAHRLRGVQ
jgi:hypothetical protein